MNQYLSGIDEVLLLLISELESELTNARCVTTIVASNMNRKSYLLEFADGSVLKGRIFESEYDAFRVTYLWKYLSPGHFPKFISSIYNALLVEWIVGDTISDLNYDISLDCYRLCGEIQGKAHVTKTDQDAINKCTKYTEFKISDSIQRSKNNVKELCKYGVIDQHKVDLLSDYIENHAPENLDIGLVLGDFCPENIVINESGSIYIIDNEKLSIDSCDYDLARTFYRWPMNNEQLRAYIEGYEQYRSYDGFRKYYGFWIIKVLVKSVLFRIKSGSKLYIEPLNKLEVVVKELHR